jgi:hypothetical protein
MPTQQLNIIKLENLYKIFVFDTATSLPADTEKAVTDFLNEYLQDGWVLGAFNDTFYNGISRISFLLQRPLGIRAPGAPSRVVVPPPGTRIIDPQQRR